MKALIAWLRRLWRCPHDFRSIMKYDDWIIYECRWCGAKRDNKGWSRDESY